MSADRELLELAAKAAGLDDAEWQDMEGWGEVRHGFSHAMWSKTLNEACGTGYWNPLIDDGDAFRLAVKLNLAISIEEGQSLAHHEHVIAGNPVQHNGRYPYAATRRAIVRAAAEIGKATS